MATVSWAHKPPVECSQVPGLRLVVNGVTSQWIGNKSVKPMSDWAYVAQVVYDPVAQSVVLASTLVLNALNEIVSLVRTLLLRFQN
jgi:hypothetical protein